MTHTNIDGTDRARPAMGDSGLGEQLYFFLAQPLVVLVVVVGT
jgi:hypothetical protein